VKVVDDYLAGRASLEAVWVTFRDLDARGVASSLPERSVPRPSAARTELKEALKRDLEQPSLGNLRARAERAYRSIIDRQNGAGRSV
jgi:hypothetical protein